MARALLPFILVAALATAAPASAAAAAPGPQWATVNVCDSAGQPKAMGVRASLPGDGSAAQMFVRFTAQWFDNSKQAWLPVQGAATSPWLDAGPARSRSRQAGWTFDFDAPAPGVSYLLRGLADLQWRSGATVVRSTSLVTSAGMAAVMAGDPAGTSLASCTIR